MDEASVSSLARAFALTFENYVIYRLEAAGALYLVGSKRPLEVDVDRFAELREKPLVQHQQAITSKLHLARRVVATGRPGDPPPSEGEVNTDDSAFVEMRAPRTSSVTTSLGDALPVRHLRAELLAPERARAAHALDILEHLMGTPDGRLPTRRPRVDRGLARRTFEGLAPALAPETRTYVEGRLALLENEKARARRLLASVASPRLAPRARRFLPFTHPPGPERIASFRDAPAAGDVWVARLREDRASVAAELPSAPPSADDDPLGWLVWHGLTTTSTLGADGRATFASLGPTLRRTGSVELLELASDVAGRSGWTREQHILEGRAVKARTRAARRLFTRGREAGAAGDFRTASRLLARAAKLSPGNGTILELLLVSLVETEDAAGLAELRRSMRFAGYHPAAIDALVEDARSGKLAAKALEAAAPGEEEDASDAPEVVPGTAGTPAPE
jgi:hypothetical protein